MDTTFDKTDSRGLGVTWPSHEEAMAAEAMTLKELINTLDAREDLSIVPVVHRQLQEKLAVIDVMSPLASSPELLSRLLGTLMKHAACSDESLSLPALQTLGAVSHRKDVCSAFTGEQVKSLITLVCETCKHTQSKVVAKLCLWLIAMQDFSAAQLNKVAGGMISAAADGCGSPATRVQQEALSAIERMLTQIPKHLVAHVGGAGGEPGWLSALLSATVSRAQKIRELAVAQVERSLPLLHAAEASQRELAVSAPPLLVHAFSRLRTPAPASRPRAQQATRRPVDAPRPSPRTNRTRRVHHPVLIGHAASLTPY